MNLPPHSFCFVGASVIVVKVVQVSPAADSSRSDPSIVSPRTGGPFNLKDGSEIPPVGEAESTVNRNHMFYKNGMESLSKAKGG